MVRANRNYAKETAYEDSPAQVRRREARNRARDRALKRGLVHKGDAEELDHIGSHRTGSLFNVPTRVVSRHANRIRQPRRSQMKFIQQLVCVGIDYLDECFWVIHTYAAELQKGKYYE